MYLLAPSLNAREKPQKNHCGKKMSMSGVDGTRLQRLAWKDTVARTIIESHIMERAFFRRSKPE